MEKQYDALETSAKINKMNIKRTQLFPENSKDIENNFLNSTDFNKMMTEQKKKFDKLVEKALQGNMSENITARFDVRKYLPKEEAYNNQKALRKYKNLINKNNNNNIINDFNQHAILSEIQIKDDSLFEEDEFVLGDDEDKGDKLFKNSLMMENLKTPSHHEDKSIQKDIKENIKYILSEIKNENENEDDGIILKIDNDKLNIVENKGKNIGYPFYEIYCESNKKRENSSINDNKNEDLNEIELLNIELSNKNTNIKHEKCNWFCMDFTESPIPDELKDLKLIN